MSHSSFLDEVEGITLEEYGASPGSNKRILVAEAWNISPHLETGLEIAIRLAISGYSVDYLHFGRCLAQRVGYYPKGSTIIDKCLGYSSSPEQRGIASLKKITHQLSLPLKILDPYNFQIDYRLINQPFVSPLTLDELQSLEWNGSDAYGNSIASALVSRLKDSAPKPQDHHQICAGLAKTYKQSYLLASKTIHQGSYQALIIFNGRLPAEKGFITAFTESSIPIYFHERGHTNKRFILKPFQVHDRAEFQKDIKYFWRKCRHDPSYISRGKSFYINQRAGADIEYTSFVSNQKPNSGLSLTSKLRRENCYSNIVVTYFVSSDDELFAIKNPGKQSKSFEWANQQEAFTALYNVCQSLKYSLVVRVHPRLASVDSRDLGKWDNLDFIQGSKQNVIVVKSAGTISSYELIDSSDVVVVNNSTIGVEAVYWGKPTIILAETRYDSLDVSLYKPVKEAELHSILSSVSDLEVNPATAIPFAAYLNTNGVDFQIYKPQDFFQGTFFGEMLMHYPVTKLHKMASRLKRLLLSTFNIKV